MFRLMKRFTEQSASSQFFPLIINFYFDSCCYAVVKSIYFFLLQKLQQTIILVTEIFNHFRHMSQFSRTFNISFFINGIFYENGIQLI